MVTGTQEPQPCSGNGTSSGWDIRGVPSRFQPLRAPEAPVAALWCLDRCCSLGRGCPTLKAPACRGGDPADAERQPPYTLITSTISTRGSHFFGFYSSDAGTQAQMSQFGSRYSWGPRRPPMGLRGKSPASQQGPTPAPPKLKTNSQVTRTIL